MPSLVMQPHRARVAALLMLSVFVAAAATIVAVGVGIWLNDRGGCWPWQERTGVPAGGPTLCDGKPSRYSSD